MDIPTEELLVKFGNAPGLLTNAEIKKIHAWLAFINPHVERYKAVYGSIERDSMNVMLEKANWYLHYHEALLNEQQR